MNWKFWKRSSSPQRQREPKSKTREWVDAIVFAVVAATLIRWLIMEPYTIPTPSMENSLLVGDFLFVSKFHYGTRTTSTPLQIPLTHQKIWFTDIPSYLPWIRLPQYRLPGVSKIKRNDVVVFNIPPKELEPDGRNYPPDLKTNYVKRCVAVAGDTLQVKNQQVIINGVPAENPPLMQTSYTLFTNGEVNERNFSKFGLGPEDYHKEAYTENGVIYTLWITDEKANEIRNSKLPYVKSIEPESRDDMDDVFPYSRYNGNPRPDTTYFRWSRDNFGPLWIPKKGATIEMTPQNIDLYGNTIAKYDLNDDAKIENGKLMIHGAEVKQYTFKQNYYFMMGDNRHNSLDSRYWGFVPENHVVGKALFIWLSIDNNTSFFHKIRWSRFFKLIR